MSRNLLAHYYRALVRSLDVTMAIEDPLKRVSKIASRAGADSQTEMLAGKILREAIRLRVNVGKDPDGLRSEEHTSELQSQSNLVCRLLLEKKKKTKYTFHLLVTCRAKIAIDEATGTQLYYTGIHIPSVEIHNNVKCSRSAPFDLESINTHR